MSENEQFKNNSKSLIEKYTLTLHYGTDEKASLVIETISGSSMIEVCSKFPLLVAQITKKIADQRISEEVSKWRNNDDIPF